MAYVGNTPSRGQWRKLTDISASFDGVTTTFTTSVPPGTSEYYVTAGTASQLIISIGGVIQEPDVDYSVSTYSITFTTAPAAGLSFFGILCGDALNTGVPSDGSITTAKLGGNLTVDLASGTAAAPSLTFDSNTGLFSPAPDEVSISTNGTERLRIDSAGQIEAVSLGTASAPTFSFTGDVNTGIYSPGADQLAVSTGGTGRLFIDSSGRVGIGTSLPQAQFQTFYTATSPSLTSNTGAGIAIGNNASVNLSFGGYPSSPYASWIQSKDHGGGGSTVPLALNPLGGNVGIGTTSPSELLHLSKSSGSTYILQTNGTATTYLGPDSSNTGLWGTSTNHDIRFMNNNTERVRIDTSGRMLVGTSSTSSNGLLIVQGYSGAPSGQGVLDLVRGGTRPSGSTEETIGQLRFKSSDNGYYAEIIGVTNGSSSSVSDTPGALVFSTTADGASSPTERMRISADGSISIGGVISGGGFSFYNTGGGPSDTQAFRSDLSGNSATTFTGWRCYSNNTGTRYCAVFHNPNGVVGSISTNASATAYTTSSDYRLKENVTAVTDGITRLQQLKPSRFNFIVDPSHSVDGFIAHEVQSVVPEAITGEKDAVDENGNPVYQGIDQSKLVPLLTAALQEAIGEIESLKARVAALESA